MEPTVFQRIDNARTLVRLARNRFAINFLWDEPHDADLMRSFIRLCHERGVTPDDLLLIHDDDLRALFEELRLPIAHRVTIRRYLWFPRIAVLNVWTAVRLSIAAVAAGLTAVRVVLRGAVSRTVLAVGVGVCAGAWMGGIRLNRSMKEAVRGFADDALRRAAKTVASPLVAVREAGRVDDGFVHVSKNQE